MKRVMWIVIVVIIGVVVVSRRVPRRVTLVGMIVAVVVIVVVMTLWVASMFIPTCLHFIPTVSGELTKIHHISPLKYAISPLKIANLTKIHRTCFAESRVNSIYIQTKNNRI